MREDREFVLWLVRRASKVRAVRSMPARSRRARRVMRRCDRGRATRTDGERALSALRVRIGNHAVHGERSPHHARLLFSSLRFLLLQCLLYTEGWGLATFADGSLRDRLRRSLDSSTTESARQGSGARGQRGGCVLRCSDGEMQPARRADLVLTVRGSWGCADCELACPASVKNSILSLMLWWVPGWSNRSQKACPRARRWC